VVSKDCGDLQKLEYRRLDNSIGFIGDISLGYLKKQKTGCSIDREIEHKIYDRINGL